LLAISIDIRDGSGNSLCLEKIPDAIMLFYLYDYRPTLRIKIA